MRDHLATCSECSAAHAELAGIPALLDLAVITGATDEEPLPPAIEDGSTLREVVWGVESRADIEHLRESLGADGHYAENESSQQSI